VLLNFFGLREQPFDVTPDLRYFYPSPTHQEALASLLYGIESRRGFLGLIAKPGMGKTTLLLELLRRLRTSARTAFVAQTQIGPRDFLRCLLAELEVDTPGGESFQMYRQLEEILIREAHSGGHLVLVIDEAQDLDEPVLEMVRVLSNFETMGAKLMEIVMAGQPSLADKLAQPALVQLRQRISVVGRLNPLNDSETQEYIGYRLRVAGYGGGSLFTPEACALIAARSEGVPRNINHLCFNALSLGYALGRRTIDLGIMEDVASKPEWDSSDEERYRVQHPGRHERPAASLVVKREQPSPDSSPEPTIKRPITGSRVSVPAEAQVLSSVASRRTSAEFGIGEPFDGPKSRIRVEEGRFDFSPVMLALMHRLAAKRAARALLHSTIVVLCFILLLLFFGNHDLRLIRVAPPTALAPASRVPGPGRAATGAKRVETRETVEAGRKTSDRLLRAEAPAPTSSSRSRAQEGTSGGVDSARLGAVAANRSSALTSSPSPQPGARPAVLSPDLTPPELESHNTGGTGATSPLLVIEEAPPGAQVFLDDQLTGSIDSGGQARISTLAPGLHHLRLSLNGYRDYEQGVDLPAGHTSRVAAKLEPSGLSILTEPAKIPSAGVAMGISPTPEPITVPVPEFVLDRTLKGHSSWVTAVAFSADGRRLASGSWDQTVKFWDVATGQGLATIDSEVKGIEALAFSHDGHLLAAESSTNTVALLDATTGRPIRTLPGGEPLGVLDATTWVYSIAFSPDSRWLAAGVDNKTVRLWEATTGRPVRDLAGLRRPVICIAFSPDGRWLASGRDDKTVGIWEAATGQEVRTLSGHTKDVYAVAFSPNGRWLASASGDKSVKLWDVSTGREVHTLAGHWKAVTSLAFSPDGRWLASGSWDKTIKIWDVETGNEVQTLSGHTHHVYTIAVDSSGRWLASGSEDGTIKLWRLRRART
jgi:type II secretory pathway predicted ATPase ExeA